MRIIALADSLAPWHSFWIRFGQYVGDFPWDVDITNQTNKLDLLSSGDCLFIYRYDMAWSSSLIEKMLLLNNKGVFIISDVDDNLWDRSTTWGVDRLRGFTLMLKHCSAITCSTENIKNLLEVMFPKKEIILMRNSTPFINKTHASTIENKLTVCWTGAPWTRPNDLEILKPLISWINAEKINVHWKHIGHSEHQLSFADAVGVPQNQVETIPLLPYKDYLLKIDADIGLAPLCRNNFNEFKSEIKLLEYSGAGIPWIASDVLPYQNLCKRWKYSGRLCNDNQHWIFHFKKLMHKNQREEEGSILQNLSRVIQSREKSIQAWCQLLSRQLENFSQKEYLPPRRIF